MVFLVSVSNSIWENKYFFFYQDAAQFLKGNALFVSTDEQVKKMLFFIPKFSRPLAGSFYSAGQRDLGNI